jgi:hypothetical protein
MSHNLGSIEQLVVRVGRKLPRRLKNRMRSLAENLLTPPTKPTEFIDPQRLVYVYGTDRLAVGYVATVASDVEPIERCIDLLNPDRPIPVICHSPDLAGRFAHSNADLVSYEEFARRRVPVLVLPSDAHEADVELRCRDVWRRTGANFAIYDAYQLSDIVSTSVLRRYRDVTLHLEASTLLPTLYSNWDYINILISEIGDAPIDVLDMFAGSGVIGFCLKHETSIRSISFCEVNYWAVRSMRRTMTADPTLSGAVWLSEGMTGMPTTATFDLIVGNPPHANLQLSGPRVLPGADPEWEAHHLFFRDAYKHLRPGGRILFIESVGAAIYEGFYKSLPAKYPQYRLGRYIEQPNHLCFVIEILRV